jgi:hypothetical protein
MVSGVLRICTKRRSTASRTRDNIMSTACCLSVLPSARPNQHNAHDSRAPVYARFNILVTISAQNLISNYTIRVDSDTAAGDWALYMDKSENPVEAQRVGSEGDRPMRNTASLLNSVHLLQTLAKSTSSNSRHTVLV